MYGFLIGIHIIICIALIITVLLQSSKGEGLAGVFGGSGITGAVFGGRGAATFLSKATTILAVAFFLSCIGLSFITPGSSQRAADSAIKKEAEKGRGQPLTPPTSTQPPVSVGEGQNVETVPSEEESKLPPVPQETEKKQESQENK